jgi:hypothetical protein
LSVLTLSWHVLFFQGAALSLLQNMAMVTGVPPLIRWLQRFRFDPQQPGADMDSLPSHSAASTTASLVLGAGTCFRQAVRSTKSLCSIRSSVRTQSDCLCRSTLWSVHRESVTVRALNVVVLGEIAVADAAVLIAELATELRLMDVTAPEAGKSEQDREKQMLFNLIQTCVLMKLLGAATDSGRLKIAELNGMLEDAWLLAVPVNGVRVSQMLAQLRYCLLQQVCIPSCFRRNALLRS